MSGGGTFSDMFHFAQGTSYMPARAFCRIIFGFV